MTSLLKIGMSKMLSCNAEISDGEISDGVSSFFAITSTEHDFGRSACHFKMLSLFQHPLHKQRNHLCFPSFAPQVLYIPRGYLHEAATSTEPSLHITLTVLAA